MNKYKVSCIMHACKCNAGVKQPPSYRCCRIIGWLVKLLFGLLDGWIPWFY
uniref:Uncharacterized protein n=1 Tax=Oryza brachyantha TaxID=4533 RepID=J3LJ81_ORYBR